MSPPAGPDTRTEALEELRDMRALAAAVSELQRKGPVKWATLGESHIQALRVPGLSNPQSATNGHRKNTPFSNEFGTKNKETPQQKCCQCGSQHS
jgi:hypothetical protein